MADTIRGDGLFRAERALAALVEDPQRLDRARERFSESPPSYRSHLSHNSTRSQSPNPPSEEERRLNERRWQLIREHRASFPSNQFEAQTSEEIKWIFKAHENRIHRVPVGTDFDNLADENVKKRWVEQGIWNEKWKDVNMWRWKHEEPLELESESETDSEAEDEAPLFSFPKERAEPKPRRPKSDEEIRRIAERRAVREREREASRPFYQFVYQVSKERERIRDESRVDGAVVPDSADINTRAYEEVKNTWIKRGIWNRKWGILPGMSWKHEQPLEEMLNEEMGDDPALVQANPLEGDGHRAGEAPPRRNPFMSPPPPAESNHQASGILNVSQQEPPAAIDPAELPNGNANHSSSAPNSRRRLTESRRSAAGQRRRRSERQPSQEGGQAPPIALTSLGPVHASKVSKAPRKKGPSPRRRPNASEELPSDAQPPLPGLDIPDLPPRTAPVPPRRSKRLQEAQPSRAADPAGVAPADSLNGASQSRPRGIMAGSSKSAASAKPPGVSKRQRTTRHRAR